MPCSKDFFKKFSGDVWIETGTYLGDGVAYAIDSGYQEIISIELSEKLSIEAAERFKNNKNVKIINGRAHDVLVEILENFKKKRIVFWLDAHYSACGTAGEDDPQPLLKELSVIKLWKEKNFSPSPVILIDDMRTFSYDQCNFSNKEIIELILSIDKSYQIKLEDGYQEHTKNIFYKDILTAKVI